ncbi:MAG: porin family protein [Sulfuritalea sp.]|jgi:hypothetical protein|nr:porin family protein [Sulfuritalea sp.]
MNNIGLLVSCLRCRVSGAGRIFLALPLILAAAAHAQELTLLAGDSRESVSKQRSGVWAFEYQHPLHENISASFAWLNEGHLPGHHRDGQTLQIWGRANLLDRRLSLAAGVGPYRYYDTAVSSSPSGYANVHGWGTVGSLAATYYTSSRWLYQLRFNRISTGNSIDTSALMFGVGYQLEPVSVRGPQGSTPYQPDKTTNNEITLALGGTILNSYQSEHSTAWALEYRHGLARHVDVTLGVLDEGNPGPLRRKGVTAQVWGVREVLASDRLILGIGVGPYWATSLQGTPAGDDRKLSWLVTATAALRLDPQWTARVSWNRVDTNYHRDTDVILLGVGYRY